MARKYGNTIKLAEHKNERILNVLQQTGTVETAKSEGVKTNLKFKGTFLLPAEPCPWRLSLAHTQRPAS